MEGVGSLLLDVLIGGGGCLAVIALALVALFRRQGRRGRIALASGLIALALVVALCTQAGSIQTALTKLNQRPSPSSVTLAVISPFGQDLPQLSGLNGRDGSIRWKQSNSVLASAAVVDGVVYTLGAAIQGYTQPPIPTITAYRLSDGAQLWRATEPVAGIVTSLVVTQRLLIYGAFVTSSQPQPTPSAIQPDPTYIAPPPSFTLYAVDRSAHTIAWSVQISDTLSGWITLAASSDMLFVGLGTGVVRALRLSDGALAWRKQIAQGSGATEVVQSASLLDVITTNGIVTALHPADGGVVWTTRLPVTFQFYEPQTSLGTLLALCGTPSGAINALFALDQLTGATLWQRSIGCEDPSPIGLDAAPIAMDGIVYTTANSALLALRASDGATLWSHTTQTDDLGFTSVQVDHGVVFAAASLVNFRSLILCWQSIPLCHNPSFIEAFDGRTGAPYWKATWDADPALVAANTR